MNRIVKLNNYVNPISTKEIEFKINELYRIGKDKALLLLNDYKKRASYESYNNQFKTNILYILFEN